MPPASTHSKAHGAEAASASGDGSRTGAAGLPHLHGAWVNDEETSVLSAGIESLTLVLHFRQPGFFSSIGAGRGATTVQQHRPSSLSVGEHAHDGVPHAEMRPVHNAAIGSTTATETWTSAVAKAIKRTRHETGR